MANKDANIAVVVNGDTSQLRKDLKKGGDSLDSFGKKAKASIAKISKMAAAATAASVVIGAGLLKTSASTAKEIQNLSQVAGVSANQFQKLTFAAKEYGLEQDKVSDILKDTNDKMGDFLATGGGALADYFENIAPKIGQTVEEFKNLTSDQVLQKYVNGLEQANVSQSEFTFYMEAIASDATALLPLLKNNGEEFNKLTENITKAGLALTDIEVEQLAKVHDTFAEMGRTTKMFINKTMVQFAPVIDVVANKFSDLTGSSQDFGLTAIKVFNAVAKMAGFLGDAIRGIEVIIKGIKTLFQAMVVGITTAVIKLLELVNSVQEAVVKSQNAIIRGLNKLPKVNIEEMIVGEMEALQKVKSFQNAMVSEMDSGIKELHNTLMEPLPSEAVDNFLNEVRKASEESAKIAVQNRQPVIFNEEDEKALADSERKYKGYYERRQEAQREHNAKMLEDHKTALNETEEVERLSWQSRTMLAVDFASNMFGNISRLMDTENKKQFKIAKAANIAQATMDGITASVGAFKVGNQIGGPILGGAFAAASAATSAAMIGKIASQQFGGGTQSMSVPTSNPATPQGANAGQTLTVQGLDSGAIFTGDAVVDLADRLLDFQRDGGRVVLGA